MTEMLDRASAGALSVRALFALSVATALIGCSGGGTSQPAPAPVNRAPSFTSVAAVTVSENATGSIYQAAATDPDGDALTYSISGGADAARFAITAAGQLSFAASPNFDLPTDSDLDNVYQLTLSVGDGRASAQLAVTITVTNSREGIAVRRVATGFVDPVAIAPIDASTALVAERAGAIYRLDPVSGARTLLYQVTLSSGGEVIGIAGAHDYATSGTFFLLYRTNGTIFFNRFLRNPAGPIVPDNFGSALTVAAPNYAGGGWVGAAANGAFFVALSDAGGVGDPANSAQNDGTRLGKLILVSPNPDPYAGASPQFFLFQNLAKGLRRPTGGAIWNGGLLLADSGQDAFEEVNLVPTGAAGTNLGWPFKEGTSIRSTPPAGLTDPVIQYPHGTGPRAGNAIVGGAVGGTTIPSLRDVYVFADRNGSIFSIAASSIQQGTTLSSATLERRNADFVPATGQIDGLVTLRAGADGVIYIVDQDGEIFRAEPE